MTIPAWNQPRVAIVTGAGQGLGEACAIRLAAEGAAVAVTDLDADTAQRTADTITGAGGTAIGLACDVAVRADIESVVSVTVEALGAPTILVNNAGISPFQSFLDISPADLDLVFGVNFRGTFEFCQIVIPHMVDAGWGRIVNISSSSAQTGSRGHTAYSATKGAVISFTRSLAKEFGRKGITVNTIPPGMVVTPSLEDAVEKGYLGPDGIEGNLAMVPANRAGQPEDIAAACAYLCRDDAGYVTGQILGVNGGRVIPGG